MLQTSIYEYATKPRFSAREAPQQPPDRSQQHCDSDRVRLTSSGRSSSSVANRGSEAVSSSSSVICVDQSKMNSVSPVSVDDSSSLSRMDDVRDKENFTVENSPVRQQEVPFANENCGEQRLLNIIDYNTIEAPSSPSNPWKRYRDPSDADKESEIWLPLKKKRSASAVPLTASSIPVASPPFVAGSDANLPALAARSGDGVESHIISSSIAGFRLVEDADCPLRPFELPAQYICYQGDAVEDYELDSDDEAFLESIVRGDSDNETSSVPVEGDDFESIMLSFECAWLERYHLALSAVDVGVGLKHDGRDDEMCSVCNGGDSKEYNQMVFCDECHVPVHQMCYGVASIPVGPWRCDRCRAFSSGELSSGLKLTCWLCKRSQDLMPEAWKRTTDSRWVHSACALWIPEVAYELDETKKWVQRVKLDAVPAARMKLRCCLCDKKGACIQCTVRTCVVGFHVTCARYAQYQMVEYASDDDEGDGSSDAEYGANAAAPRQSFSSSGKRKRKKPREAWCERHATVHPPAGGAGSTARRAAYSAIKRGLNKKKRGRKPKGLQQSQLADEEKARSESDCLPFAEAAVLLESYALSEEQMRSIYEYWRRRRQANGGRPLLRGFHLEQARKGAVLDLLQGPTEELERVHNLTLRLRGELDMARQLSGLIVRRETLKRSVVQSHRYELMLQQDPVAALAWKWASDLCYQFGGETDALKKFSLKSFASVEDAAHFLRDELRDELQRMQQHSESTAQKSHDVALAAQRLQTFDDYRHGTAIITIPRHVVSGPGRSYRFFSREYNG